MICKKIAMTNVPIEKADRMVHLPGASRPQNRKKASEKPIIGEPL